MVNALDLRSRVGLPSVLLSCNDLGQVVHSVTKQYNLVYRPKGGDALWLRRSGGRWCRSGVTPDGIATYGLNGLEKGDEHPAYALLLGYGNLS